jgi:CheY-like chemotaxis protein
VATTAPPPAGAAHPTLLAKRYRLDRRLAHGGMSEVWVATDTTLDRQVAIKLLKASLADDPVVVERFRREAISAAGLNHPYIVSIYDTIEADGRAAVVMELVPGRSLRNLLDESGRLGIDETLVIGRAVAAALDHAHQAGLVHRDVKPGNVLVDNVRSYLTDFGLTKRIASRTALTAAGRTVGTAAYLAPEQIRGQDVDARTDIYAFGCVLYECLTGDVPFVRDTDMAVLWAHLEQEPDPPSRHLPELPKEVDAVFLQALAKRKEDRFASAGELMKAVAEATNAMRPESSSRNRVPVTTVLVASGDRAARSMIEATLAEGRVAVAGAPDAERAIDQAQAHPPGLAFVDADLPGGAIALCQRLRSTDEAAATRIVMLVGRGAQFDRAAAKQAGVDDFLPKPFSALQLMAKLRDFVPDALAG